LRPAAESLDSRPPFRVLEASSDMYQVLSRSMLREAQQRGVACFFTCSIAACLQAKLAQLEHNETFHEAVFANWDLKPQTVWMQVRRSESSSNKESLLATFIPILPARPGKMSQRGTPAHSESAYVHRASGPSSAARPSLLGRPRSPQPEATRACDSKHFPDQLSL